MSVQSKLGVLCKLACMAALSSLACVAGCAAHVTHMPEASETVANWQAARNFQAQGRYELARQYYVVALATARSPETQTTLKREIEATDRMLQAFR